MKQVPENLINLLLSHASVQDDSFLEGFCNCLSYQYPESSLSKFYDHYEFSDDFETFKQT